MVEKKPNILVIWGDDIGLWNISFYSHGLMGYQTPNIDRIAAEGVAFTDYYGQQSCTAGRACFITGQNPIRTGLTKVGMPGAKLGIQPEDPTIAELLKPLGYATGQFGKNHLGDRNEFLPTVHGFDEFFGNLYHLNAEEEPELPDYPKDPEFLKKFGPRNVIHSWATEEDDSTVQPRWGRIGKQKIKDKGPLYKKRMETIDDEITENAIRWIKDTHKAGKPFFLWYNTTGMHVRTHAAKKHLGKSGQGFYNDVMVAHDENVGKLLNLLDDLGIADDTIVLYSTDNGTEYFSWPDGGITPFRSEKDTNWEGGWRVPSFARWPGKFSAGKVLHGIVSHQDWLPTLLAAAGEPNIIEKLRQGHKAGNKIFKVHIDGYNMLPYLTGETKESPRKSIFYFSDDGDLMALRYKDWKIVFMEQLAHGMAVWWKPLVTLRMPNIYNLRRDPLERASIDSKTWGDWIINHFFVLVPAQVYVSKQIQSFKEFPPRQKPASFNLDQVLNKLQDATSGRH